jgi:hypothetical protein
MSCDDPFCRVRKCQGAGRGQSKDGWTYLKQTQENTADGELPPRLDKRHADHDDAKAEYDKGEPDAGADLAEDNVRGELLLHVSIDL